MLVIIDPSVPLVMYQIIITKKLQIIQMKKKIHFNSNFNIYRLLKILEILSKMY